MQFLSTFLVQKDLTPLRLSDENFLYQKTQNKYGLLNFIFFKKIQKYVTFLGEKNNKNKRKTHKNSDFLEFFFFLRKHTYVALLGKKKKRTITKRF